MRADYRRQFCRSPTLVPKAGGAMSRGRYMTTFVLGLSLGVPLVAEAQSVATSWQSTPASVLKNELRNVVAAQDKYRTAHPLFASTLEALQVNPGSDVKIQIMGVTPSGW